jgi:hypothetical protein
MFFTGNLGASRPYPQNEGEAASQTLIRLLDRSREETPRIAAMELQERRNNGTPEQVRLIGLCDEIAKKEGSLDGLEVKVANFFREVHKESGASAKEIAEKFNEVFALMSKSTIGEGSGYLICTHSFVDEENVSLSVTDYLHKPVLVGHLYFNIKISAEEQERITTPAARLVEMIESDFNASVLDSAFGAALDQVLRNRTDDDQSGRRAAHTLLAAVSDQLRSSGILLTFYDHPRVQTLLIHKIGHTYSYVYDFSRVIRP